MKFTDNSHSALALLWSNVPEARSRTMDVPVHGGQRGPGVSHDQGGLLVVDDEPFLRDAVAASLRFLGFEVTTAQTGSDALRLARDRAFDLVVLDVMLPDVDGFDVVRRLRRGGSRVPVIFLTAKDTQADKVAGLTLGGDDYMTKPFGLEELAARIRTVLRRTRPAADGTLVAGTSLDAMNHTVDQLELIVVFGSLAAVALIGGGVLLLLRRGLRPIEAMAAQADRISAGDLTDRVRPHDPRSEVGRLGAALNGMLARIQAFVHEREAGQEVMRRFFADASHELRTPLASLRANAELYQQGALSERGQVDEVMRRISLETRRMSALVDDMLRLARLDQRPDRARDEVDISELVVSCAERAMIAEPGRRWDVDITLGMVTIGDEELLRRAVDNLIANVHAHTPEDTVATITASPDVDAEDADCIVIEVNDDGPGVPPDKLPRIFDRFYRAANPASSRPGSGLGLAIVAEIAAAHRGTVEADANDPQGLRVTLTLPVERESETASEPSRTAVGATGPAPDPGCDSGPDGEIEPYPYRVIKPARLSAPLSLPAAPGAPSVGTPVQARQTPLSGPPAAAGSGGSSPRPSATAEPSRH